MTNEFVSLDDSDLPEFWNVLRETMTEPLMLTRSGCTVAVTATRALLTDDGLVVADFRETGHRRFRFFGAFIRDEPTRVRVRYRGPSIQAAIAAMNQALDDTADSQHLGGSWVAFKIHGRTAIARGRHARYTEAWLVAQLDKIDAMAARKQAVMDKHALTA